MAVANQNFFTPDGRVDRMQFWLITLSQPAILLASHFVFHAMSWSDLDMTTFVVLIVCYWPILIQRCHDRDKSGWWSFLILIPVLGQVWAVVELGVLRGTIGPNRFGPDPGTAPHSAMPA